MGRQFFSSRTFTCRRCLRTRPETSRKPMSEIVMTSRLTLFKHSNAGEHEIRTSNTLLCIIKYTRGTEIRISANNSGNWSKLCRQDPLFAGSSRNFYPYYCIGTPFIGCFRFVRGMCVHLLSFVVKLFASQKFITELRFICNKLMSSSLLISFVQIDSQTEQYVCVLQKRYLPGSICNVINGCCFHLHR